MLFDYSRGVWGDIVGNERFIYLKSSICWKYILPLEPAFTLGRPFRAESFGQLVGLGFDVTVFTPAPYQRHRL